LAGFADNGVLDYITVGIVNTQKSAIGGVLQWLTGTPEGWPFYTGPFFEQLFLDELLKQMTCFGTTYCQ
jgi:hypothetical protein